MVQNKTAKVTKIGHFSPIWIVPIITVIIGLWVIFSYLSNRGDTVTLITTDASGIVAGKTVIKSRSVEVGKVESVTLSDDFQKVIITGRIRKDLASLVKNDSVFWIVKPEIDRGGVTGLSTLLSGVYIEMAPGQDKHSLKSSAFKLLDSAPITAPNVPGIRINLTSKQPSAVSKGAPVLFRGFKVGTVESAEFDAKNRVMRYQAFIPEPYDQLVTENVRFWREGGFNLDLSSHGARLDFPSLDVMLAGGISFDVPKGSRLGDRAKNNSVYVLYANEDETQDSQYTESKEFLLFFKDSIAGLNEGAPVEYRGIRLGTVVKVPFYLPSMNLASFLQYDIPVLIRIEPERVAELDHTGFNLTDELLKEQKNGLRAALKSANLFTGALYVDIDFYAENDKEANRNIVLQKVYGYDTIQTVSAGLSQIQAKFIQTLDKINQLPLQDTVQDLDRLLQDSRKMVNSLQRLTGSKEAQQLPKDLQQTMQNLNQTLKGLQPGSPLHQQLNSDLQKLEQVMNQLQPLLNTLNSKSNALVFKAPSKRDLLPKGKSE